MFLRFMRTNFLAIALPLIIMVFGNFLILEHKEPLLWLERIVVILFALCIVPAAKEFSASVFGG